MGYLLSGISEIFLVLAVIGAVLVAYLTRRLYSSFQISLTTIKEKQSGLIYSYRRGIRQIFGGNRDEWGILSLIHLILLHLLAPLMTIGLLLHTDWNFLIVVLSLGWSYQIAMRLYPGYELEEARQDENNPT